MSTDLDNDRSFLRIKSAVSGGHCYDAYVADDTHHAMMVIRKKVEEMMGVDWNNDDDSEPMFTHWFLRRDGSDDFIMADAYADWLFTSDTCVFLFKDGVIDAIGVIVDGIIGGDNAKPHQIEWYAPVPSGLSFVLEFSGNGEDRVAHDIEAELPGNINRSWMVGSGNSYFHRSTMRMGYRMGGILISELTGFCVNEMTVEAAEEFLGVPRRFPSMTFHSKEKATWMLDCLSRDARTDVRRMLAMNPWLYDFRLRVLLEDPDWRVRREIIISSRKDGMLFATMAPLLDDPVEEVRFTAAVTLLDPHIRTRVAGEWPDLVGRFMGGGHQDDGFRPAIMARIMEA